MALIITIIILLILAGITLGFVLGKNGIINMAQSAGKNYIEAEKEEGQTLNELYSSMMVATNDEAMVNISMKDLKELIKMQVQEELTNYNVPRFIDINNVLTTITTQGASWTATEDCAVVATLMVYDNMTSAVYVDGIAVSQLCEQEHPTKSLCTLTTNTFYVKKGSTITTRENYGTYNITVYGLK